MKDSIKRSLRKRLLSLMQEISEDHYCAGWMSGLEYSDWKRTFAAREKASDK